MEVDHAFGQTAPQFINAGDQCFEVVAVFNARVFRDFFEALAFEADQEWCNNNTLLALQMRCGRAYREAYQR